jgi:LPS-assembly protein
VGFVYQGLFANGASIDAVAGQSFQLAGENSFAMNDIALTGVGSGLDSEQSDYVSRVTLNTGTGLALTARGRFDSEDLALNRGETNALATFGDSIFSLGYAFIRESPASGVFENRQEVSGAASLAVSNTWSVLGGLTYDIENDSTVTRSFGVAFDNDCVGVSALYSETPDRYSDLVTGREFFVRVSLRTLSDTTPASLLRNGVD